MLRSFISIDIEDPLVLKRIEEISREIKKTGAIIKLVESQNIHMTLRFLGEIDEKEVEVIKRIMEDKLDGFKKFEIELRGVGAFPSISNPRVIWVGVGKGSMELKTLANIINRGLKDIGTHKETRPFSPHITIARVKRYNSSLRKKIEEYKDEDFGSIIVKEVRLKKSKLTPTGPIYTTLYSKALE